MADLPGRMSGRRIAKPANAGLPPLHWLPAEQILQMQKLLAAPAPSQAAHRPRAEAAGAPEALQRRVARAERLSRIQGVL
jgi:hypothetical protein